MTSQTIDAPATTAPLDVTLLISWLQFDRARAAREIATLDNHQLRDISIVLAAYLSDLDGSDWEPADLEQALRNFALWPPSQPA